MPTSLTGRVEALGVRVRGSAARVLAASVVLAAVLACPTVAAAQTTTVTASWDGNTDTVTRGYTLYYGTSSGSYAWSYDAGSQVEVQLALELGKRYFFVVRAYASDGSEGPPSSEGSIDLTASAVPTATITASATSSASALVSWSTTNAVGASINGQAVALSGSTSVAISGSTTFTLVAWSSSGVTVSRSATVSVVPPAPTPTAWLSAVMLDASTARVTWSTTDAATVTLNGTAVDLQGVLDVPVSGTVSFVVVATSSTGVSVTQTAVVTAVKKGKGSKKSTTAG